MNLNGVGHVVANELIENSEKTQAETGHSHAHQVTIMNVHGPVFSVCKTTTGAIIGVVI